MTFAALPGISGNLFPVRYLAEQLARDAAIDVEAARLDTVHRRLQRWWRRVELGCGPATAVRAIFDVAAMPLFGALGYRARRATFDRSRAWVVLETPSGAAVALAIGPWASRPSGLWREVVTAAREVGARWAFILTPPYVSLLPAEAAALRRSVDFAFPEVLEPHAFRHFWTLARASALEDAAPRAGTPAGLERLVACAARHADRVRGDLQRGVIQSLDALVKTARGSRPGDRDDAVGQSLTIIYRVLFLLFAESRDLVPRDHPIYRDSYSMGSLCADALAADTRGLWDGLGAITRLSRQGCDDGDLIVRPFNGALFARHAAPVLESGASASEMAASAKDAALGSVLVALATRPGAGGRESIHYADLGVEQLGSVYERVLDIDPSTLGRLPDLSTAPARGGLRHSARRKESGTFYTPQSLCDFVVRRTLAPLVSGAGADEILSLRVVDPAMGSGAFLVAACQFLSAAYEHALIEEGRCSESDVDDSFRATLRRRIAERCLIGVDVNPVAVQLARLSLWLTTLAEGKPVTFLDHRLRVGNSLIGAAPDQLRRVRDTPGRRSPRPSPLFDAAPLDDSIRQVVGPLGDLCRRENDTIDDARAKETAWRALTGARSPLRSWRSASDLWCARWFTSPQPAAAELRAGIDAILGGDPTLGVRRLNQLKDAASTAAAERHFFHWPLEFPDVYFADDGRPRRRPGFDAVIGNPPWEMLRHDPKAGTEGVDSSTLVRFLRDSGLYPSCDRGHINLYQPFVDRALELARLGGRVGLVLPWGVAVDDGSARLRRRLFDSTHVDVIIGLDNGHALFPIHRGLRFVVVVTQTGRPSDEFAARFGLRTAAELDDLPSEAGAGDRLLRLSTRRLELLSGPARRVPDARRPAVLALAERLARMSPALGAPEGWNVRFGRELNATEDRAALGAIGLPVIEGKHLEPFRVDVGRGAARISVEAAAARIADRRFERPRLAYRDVSGAGNRLSLIAAIVPARVVTTHTLFCLRTPLALQRQHFLAGVFNSYVLNAFVRLLMGGHVTTSLVEQLPVPRWTGSRLDRRIAGLARLLARRPNHVDAAAVLQARVARRYGLSAEEYATIIETFPLVSAEDRRRALEAWHGAGDTREARLHRRNAAPAGRPDAI